MSVSLPHTRNMKICLISLAVITALRTAVEKGDGTLDKEATSHEDCLNAFRMSLQFWH